MAEQADTAVAVPPEATDEELERAALLSSWRSRPGDPVSVVLGIDHGQIRTCSQKAGGMQFQSPLF